MAATRSKSLCNNQFPLRWNAFTLREKRHHRHDEQKEDYMKICVPLHCVALRGDCPTAEGILSKYPKVVNMSITHKEYTLLHIVSATKHTHFLNKLVNKLNVVDLELQNNEGATALWLVVASTDKMVDIFLKKNKGLLKIRTNGSLPLLCAIWAGHKDIVELMYSNTNIADEKWKESDKKCILNSCIAAELFDIALKIINHCKKEGTLMIIGTEALRYFAYKPAAFDEKIRPSIKRLVNTSEYWGYLLSSFSIDFLNKKHVI